MKYTQLIPLKEGEYDVAAATSIEEDQELLKAGLEYVTERNGIKLYCRPKIFAKYMDKGYEYIDSTFLIPLSVT
jgi:hypothetical protein